MGIEGQLVFGGFMAGIGGAFLSCGIVLPDGWKLRITWY